MVEDLWDDFVERLLPLGEVTERRSRYGDKPALVLGGREIAHSDGPGEIDLRVTAAVWREYRCTFGEDPAVSAGSSRRDWIGLRLASRADLDRLAPLLERAVAGNR